MTTATPTPYLPPLDPYEDDPAVQVDASLPMWREGFSIFELICLRLSPVYYGCGVPRGNGQPVVLAPGFLGGDGYLTEMFWWLARIGYRPFYSRIVFNADCPDATSEDLVRTVRRAQAEIGERVSIVGHSLGGMLASSVARRAPDAVAGVIALGAPIAEVAVVSPFIRAATESLRASGGVGRQTRLGPSCFSGFCTCAFVAHAMASDPTPVPRYAIYSKTDGVVHWSSCMDADPERNVEVRSSHSGMAWNAEVYRAVAECLAALTEGLEQARR